MECVIPGLSFAENYYFFLWPLFPSIIRTLTWTLIDVDWMYEQLHSTLHLSGIAKVWKCYVFST